MRVFLFKIVIMKKILIFLMVILTTFSVNAKCDWSGYWMKKVNQQQNVYTFQTNIDWDSCVDYTWLVYDYQLKRWDTLQDFRGYTQVQFNVKGKYKVGLKAINKCTKPWCDTFLYQIIDITIYGKADVDYKVGAHNCKYYSFKMTEFDTCVEYYYAIYKDSLFEELGEYWDTSSNLYLWLYKNYDFAEEDLVYYNLNSQREVIHTFQDSGRHLLWAYWYNKCTGIDTWVMKKIDVCVTPRMLNVKHLKVSEPKLIGVYDMLGRPVYNIRENEILIYIYSDGTRKKIFKSSN